MNKLAQGSCAERESALSAFQVLILNTYEGKVLISRARKLVREAEFIIFDFYFF